MTSLIRFLLTYFNKSEDIMFYSNLICYIVAYIPNDKKGTVTILTVGENIECSIEVFHF